MNKIASVIVENTAKEVDRYFDYVIPPEMEGMARIGLRVVVPFGRGDKLIEGYIVDIKSKTGQMQDKMKNLYDINDDTVYFDKEMFELAQYMKDKYNCTLSEAFGTIMPSGIKAKEFLALRLNPQAKNPGLAKYQNLISLLDCQKFIEFSKIRKKYANIRRAIVYEMEREGIVEIKRDIKQDTSIKTMDILHAEDLGECMNFIKNCETRYKRQAEVLKDYMEHGLELTQSEICSRYSCSPSVVRALVDKGFLIKRSKEMFRNPISKDYCYGRVSLTREQVDSVENILKNYENDRNITLIHGVTGSGKTEIYLSIVEKLINDGYGAIILVPEIALTPQTLERFRGRFGDTVAILHSRLSKGERYDEWRRIKDGDVKVVVGARSAVFAPVKNLKLIIIDEEHEYTYKSDGVPRYDTRDIAAFRVKQNSGLLVMGSATPSMESYYKALNGEYNLITISKRVNNIMLPQVKTVDMREELKNGNKSVFSRELFESIERNLQNKQQTILFLNRRGYSTFISCRSCGYVCKCSNCDVSLTYHITTDKLACHYCGEEYKSPSLCPKCGSKYIKYFGTGTEKIEMEIHKYFPSAKVLRMDMDTTRKKGQHEKIYDDFKNHKADILIGTQMISKGMDFSGVTLVGIIAADSTLNLPDFRAAERTFQLVTQVSGRAGRGSIPGRVIVQTYDPEHYSIVFAADNDYTGFYNKEIYFRKILNNPPFTDIMNILFQSEREEDLIKYCMTFKEHLREIEGYGDLDVLGPTPCHIPKIKNNFRWHAILKGNVFLYFKQIDEIVYKSIGNSIAYTIDINPYSTL